MDDEIRTKHDDKLDITNAPAASNAPVAASNAAEDGDARALLGDTTPDDAAATLLGRAGAVTRALAADDTDNDG